jgi:hypothetical protein
VEFLRVAAEGDLVFMAKGRIVWLVKEHSFQPAGDDSEWRVKVAGFIRSGLPGALFPTTLITEEAKAHAN